MFDYDDRQMERAERDRRDLELLAKLRAHPALDWHLTDIEGARDAAESPEAREICELTMQLLAPGNAGRGEAGGEHGR